MDNKLSELSKPVGFVSKQAQALLKSGDTASVRPFFDVQGSSPLYSQEYVSALIQRDERIDSMLTESVQALKAAEQRIAELEEVRCQLNLIINSEANRADAAEKRVAELSELETQVKVWESATTKHLERAEEAEKRLATPVRLPQLCGDGDNDTEYTEGLNDGITQSAIYLRRQGFTVEGDE